LKATLLAALGALIVCGGLGLTAVAVAGHAADTKVTIRYSNTGQPGGPDDSFHGKLKSDKAKCVRHRKVNVYRLGGGREYHVVYSDTTNRRGRWRTDNALDLFGKFYAATRRIAGCKGAQSEKIDNRSSFAR